MFTLPLLASLGLAQSEVPAVGPAEAPSTEVEARWPTRFPGQTSPGDPHFDLEILYAEKKFKEGLRKANERLAKTPNDVDLHWMKVRFLYEIGERFGDDESIDRVAYYKEMLRIAERGMKLDPGNMHLHFAIGVSMGRLGTTRGVLASLFMAKDVEQNWLAVAEQSSWNYSSLDGGEMLPCDVFHGLGIFYRLVPDWWIVQVLAGTRGNLQESLRFNRLSTECKPQEIQNWKELAATQYCLYSRDGDEQMKAAADRAVQRGLAIPARHFVNRLDHKHLRSLREDPSTACEYSRDGQQDLDEKKLRASE